MLEIKNLSKKFENNLVLDNINLSIKEGEIISLLGQSGSGKSTLLNIIAGFEESNDGSIIYNDITLINNNTFIEPQNRDIGFVFQNYALFPHLNVKKNIAFGINHLEKKYQDESVDKLLKLINLIGLENNYPHELSGGQQQRVAIARVLARNSKLILFDEPFSSIDSTLKAKIIKEIKEILKSYNITAIFVTHNPNEAILLSDRIGYIEDGKIIQFDSIDELKNNPKSTFIKDLFN